MSTPASDLTTIQQRLLKIAQRELGIDSAALDAETPLTALGDSLDFVNLLGSIEADLNIDINNERLPALKSVGDLVHLIRDSLAERAARAGAPH